MLTIIAGEDTVQSRKKLQDLKEQYKTKGFAIGNVAAQDVPDLLKSAEGVVNLFGEESIYVVEKLSGKYKGRAKTPFKQAVQDIAKHSTIHLIDWESSKSAYELSALKRIATTFSESKPPKGIFELLDACIPGNLSGFLQAVETVSQTQDSGFIYAMLCKHVRKLILAAGDKLDSKTSPWQRGKLKSQASMWDTNKLMKFYEGLAGIDMSMKTSSTRYDLQGSIELLVCYYLK